MQKRNFSFNFKRNADIKAFLYGIFVKALSEDAVMDHFTKKKKIKKINNNTHPTWVFFFFFLFTSELDLELIKLDFVLELKFSKLEF